ncbi:FBD-like protein [Artemisia annua]|uniref:FBD-like protein n=1 Tax=Artemisia annua TaxID=35608 RepID=A0A2U1LX27_ARTAN|nr:FBD-like protein [Artemisia annua]
MSPRCKKVDRLSSLPEKVHSVILSLMPTKFAVRTSILSKRWRYTWTLIHNLDFDDIRSNSYSHVDRVLMLCKTTCVKILRLHFSKTKIHVPDSTVSRWISEAVRLNGVKSLKDESQIILSKRWRYTWTLIHNLDFDDIRSNSYSHVDRVLMLCKTTCVKILRLHFSKTKIHVPDSTVSRWISEAVRLNVSELDISNVGLPLSLFTCNTLSKLSLKLIEHYNKFSLECPPSIYLPNLKTLDIIAMSERFDYANPISCDNIFKLIHGCPLLEDLSLKIHLPYNTEDLYFKAPTLKRLRLALSYGSSRDIHKVVLNVPNLEYLHIEEGFAKCSLFVMEDLSSLVKAKVSCGVFYNHLWVELVKGLSKVRNLTLDTASEVIGHAFKNVHFPEFPHVKKLDLVGCDPFTLREMLRFQILKRFCQLEHLCIKKEQEGRWSEPNSFPTLTFTNMLTVEYTDTTCWEEFNTNFLKFILANAIDLKKLIVRYNSDLVTCKEREQLDAELSMLPRASRNCQIHLAPYN